MNNIEAKVSHIQAQDTLINSLRIQIDQLNKDINKVRAFYGKEVKRLERKLSIKQAEINLADETHFDEVTELQQKIKELELKALNS